MKALRVIDLFCGGGGLSLGFHKPAESVEFDVVMGIDNDPPAIRVFNTNCQRSETSRLPIGRLVDMTWFHHPTEIQLFYLVHLAETGQDGDLPQVLGRMDLSSFLSGLRARDRRFGIAAAELASTPEYTEAYADVPTATFSLALCKAFLGKLGLAALSTPTISERDLPWCQEYGVLECDNDSAPVDEPIPDIESSLSQLWSEELEKLRASSEKTGHGQNANNASRVETLVRFLESQPGRRLKRLWVEWRSGRDSDRARFCLQHADLLQKTYSARRVHLILGGPPCKGFSRIGRPVIDSLREQGIHAWSHHEFGDERNALMIQYVLFLEALKPDAFVFENVSNFQSALRTPGGVLDAPEVLRSLIAELSNEDASYHVSCRVLNAKDFSVPQDRRRFIMVGVNAKKSLPRVVEEFFASSVSRQSVSLNAALWALGTPLEFALGGDVRVGDEVACFDMSSDGMATEVAEYWNWVRQPSPNKRKPPRHTDGHVYRRMRSDDAAFLRFVAPNTRWMDLKIAGTETLEELRTFIEKARDEIGTRELKKQAGVWLKSINDEFWLKILLEHVSRKYGLAENHLLGSTYLKNGAGTHGDWFERLSASKPSKTIVAHIGKDTYGYFHPFENRAISIREAARIQSFPDFYRFGSAGVVDAYSIIGNAVPPLLARHFAVVLANLHEKHRIFDDADRFAVVRTQPPQQESLSL